MGMIFEPASPDASRLKKDSNAEFKHRLISFGMAMKSKGDGYGIEWEQGERFETWLHRITDAEVFARA